MGSNAATLVRLLLGLLRALLLSRGLLAFCFRRQQLQKLDAASEYLQQKHQTQRDRAAKKRLPTTANAAIHELSDSSSTAIRSVVVVLVLVLVVVVVVVIVVVDVVEVVVVGVVSATTTSSMNTISSLPAPAFLNSTSACPLKSLLTSK